MISEKQTQWGTKFLETLSKDLQDEFPEMKGFSVTNLKYCKLFYNYYSIRPQPEDELRQQLVVQIPWGHIKLIIGKIKDIRESQFYIEQTIANYMSSILVNKLDNLLSLQVSYKA